MKALRRWLVGSSVLALLALAPSLGCASHAEDSGDDDEGALGIEESGKIIQTGQTDLLLFQGYNTVFDQGHAGCVTYPSNLSPQIGDVGVDVKVSWVNSREDLAKELGFDADLSFKLPKVGADARAEVMNSFKRNSASTNMLVRVGSYYNIDAGQNYSLTPEAQALLDSDPRGFFQRCGDAVVTRLQYRAEVIGLLRFDSNDQEKNKKTAGTVGANGPVATVADASAKVNASVSTMQKSNTAQMTLELHTQGFVPDSKISVENLEGQAALARLNELLVRMADSVNKDRARDAQAVAQGKIPMQAPNAPASGAAPSAIQRSARLGAMAFQAYAKRTSTSTAGLTQITQDTNKFLTDIGHVQGPLENVYYEETSAFLGASDQEAYNTVTAPKATVGDLAPIAQKWSGLLKPAAGANTISAQLKDAELACVRFGLSGDFSKCKSSDALNDLLAKGRQQLADYANERILRMNILYGSPGEVTVDAAKAACTKTGGRLPMDTEMEYLKPALAAKGGLAWVTSQSCPKNIGIYSGQNKPTCYDGWYMDWYDNLLDTTGLSKRAAPVFCVAATGPKSAIALPGQ